MTSIHPWGTACEKRPVELAHKLGRNAGVSSLEIRIFKNGIADDGHFYKPQHFRPLEDPRGDVAALKRETEGLFGEIVR